MYSDVIDLRDFYETPLGQTARRMIRRRLRLLWPNTRGDTVLGIGYAVPYLRPFLGEAARVVAVMPARQGVLHWPPEGPSRTVLADEDELPLPDLSVDRVLVVHGLEGTEQLRPMLREIWRVMSDRGQVLLVVPNRRGIWSRLERSPFGYGHPYTTGQLSALLRANMFTPLQTATALFFPPIQRRLMQGAAPAWESAGERWFPAFSGVVMVEATKEIYAMSARAERKRRRLIVPLPTPVRGAAESARRHRSSEPPPD
jgi:hypothetical protein